MLKQGVKTIIAGFTRTSGLSQLSFIQFKPYTTSFLGLLLSLTLIPKSKKTMDTSLDLKPLFKTSLDAWVEGLVSNVDYLENQHHNFNQKKYDRKRSATHTFPSLHCRFSFCMDFLNR